MLLIDAIDIFEIRTFHRATMTRPTENKPSTERRRPLAHADGEEFGEIN
jgi:hypothetical protein